MKKYLIIIVGIFSSLLAYSQGSVSGSILDHATEEVLPFATVRLVENNQVVQSDENGIFKMESVPAGKYTMEISFVGLEKYSDTIFVVDGEELKLGRIDMGGNIIGLKEVEVFSNFLNEEDQNPNPTTTISEEMIDQKMGAQEFAELMKSSPGVFVSTVGGSFGSSEVRIRGFGSENTAVLINGIPVNDMENGRVFWSNWGGLNDVTRNQQVQRGLGASKLAISSIGGTINILTKPTEFRKGVKASYAYSNRTYSNRYMVTTSTGMMKNGLAITASGSARTGVGFREGTQTEAYSYFLTAYKELGDKHQLMFTAFGAPQNTWGGRSVTQSSYEVVGDSPQSDGFLGLVKKGSINYNPSWGYRDGEVFSAAQNRYHKPMFIVNHYWDVKPKWTLSTSAYYSFGKGGGTTIDRTATAENSVPIPFNLQPGAGDSTWQIQWDNIIKENRRDSVTVYGVDGVKTNSVTGYRSQYVLVRSMNDHKWLGAITSLNGAITPTLNVTFGVDYRWYRGYHYRLLEDLLGGDFWIDQERFNQQPDNNLLQPTHAAKEGETVGYNYSGTVAYGGTFAQLQKTIGKVDIFGTATYSYTTFYRNGKFLHAEFTSEDPSESSLGFSNVKNFHNYTLKGGANYKINGRHNVYGNVGRFTRAPFFRNAFIDNRVSNQYRDNLQSEKFFSLEAGYGYRAPRLAGHANVYRTFWQDRAYVVSLPSAVFEGNFVNFALNDVDALHQGVEFDAAYSLIKDLKITGMLSVGDWRYQGNAEAIVLQDPGLGIVDNPKSGKPSSIDPVDLNIDGLRVGGAAQTTSSLGLYYRGKQRYYCGFDYNFYSRLYADFNPETKVYDDAYFNQVQRVPDASTIDIYGGKTWVIKAVRLQLKVNVNNILNNQFPMDVNERVYTGASAPLNGRVPAPAPFVQYYFGRTYFASVVVSF